MANSIDLNFDAKRAFGEYFPTVYLDFVEVSYGMELIEGTDELRYSYNRETGTHLNGSFSIYQRGNGVSVKRGFGRVDPYQSR